jgi:hypothetical protein
MKLMYEKVLVALDLSESSERVVGAARDLAFLAKSEVCVLHLREREPDPRIGMEECGTASRTSSCGPGPR